MMLYLASNTGQYISLDFHQCAWFVHNTKASHETAVKRCKFFHNCVYSVHVITFIRTQNTYYARVITVIQKQCTYYVHVITIIWSHNESCRELHQTVSLTVIRALFPTGVMSYFPFNGYPDVIGFPLRGKINQQQATHLFTQNPTLDRIFTNLVTTFLSSIFDAVNRCI